MGRENTDVNPFECIIVYNGMLLKKKVYFIILLFTRSLIDNVR